MLCVCQQTCLLVHHNSIAVTPPYGRKPKRCTQYRKTKNFNRKSDTTVELAAPNMLEKHVKLPQNSMRPFPDLSGVPSTSEERCPGARSSSGTATLALRRYTHVQRAFNCDVLSAVGLHRSTAAVGGCEVHLCRALGTFKSSLNPLCSSPSAPSTHSRGAKIKLRYHGFVVAAWLFQSARLKSSPGDGSPGISDRFFRGTQWDRPCMCSSPAG